MLQQPPPPSSSILSSISFLSTSTDAGVARSLHHEQCHLFLLHLVHCCCEYQEHSRHLGPPFVCIIVPGCGKKLGIRGCTCALSVSVTRLWLPSLHPSLRSLQSDPNAPRTRGGRDPSQGSLLSAVSGRRLVEFQDYYTSMPLLIDSFFRCLKPYHPQPVSHSRVASLRVYRGVVLAPLVPCAR